MQLLPALRSEVVALDTDVPLSSPRTLPGIVSDSVGARRFRLSIVGVAIGIVAALLATRALSSLVYQVSTTDPLTLAATGALLVAAATLASTAPALRATRLDPSASLRAE